MRLSKKAIRIIDMQQYRAYGLGYIQAVKDMQIWFTADFPGVVLSKLDVMGSEAATFLEAMNRENYKEVSAAAREHVAELHKLLGISK